MKTIVKLFITSIFAISINSVFGQFQGPATLDNIYTVKEIKENASKLDRSDQLVKVKGFIIKQINKDDYTFQDSTETIRVELKKKYMPVQPFDDKTELIMICEVDYDMLEGVELEVEEIVEIVKK
jgi:uncharacterized protein (TIGR00156 family)